MASNGQLPNSALAPIAQGRLERAAAAAWNTMNAESRKRGLELHPTGSMSSYRTLEQQKLLYAQYLRGGNLAAKPGTSNHGWGLAVDVPTQQMRSMIDAIGAKFGWAKAWSDAPSEWWHIKYAAGHYSGPDPGPHGSTATTVTMYDSIDLTQIPANPEAVAGYVGGRWPTYNELVAKYPHAHHLSVAVTSRQAARCLDVEPGDASPAQAPEWYRHYADRDHGLPVLYCSASTVGQVIGVMSTAGFARARYLIWSAHYTHSEHICSPSVCGFPQADATQWTDKAHGRNLDQSCCAPHFFGAGPTPPAEEEIVAISATECQGVPHVFYEAKDGSVWYTWQKKGESGWQGGSPGKSPAALKLFAPAPKS